MSLLLAIVACLVPVALATAPRIAPLSPGVASGLVASGAVLGAAALIVSWIELRRKHRYQALGLLAGGLAALGGSAVVVLDLATVSPPRSISSSISSSAEVDEVVPERLRVLSLNVKHDYPDFADNEERARAVAELIRSADADVVLLQEAWRVARLGDLTEQLSAHLGLHAVYQRANGSLHSLGFEEGLAILSRFPFESAEGLTLEPTRHRFEHRLALSAVLRLSDEVTLGVANTHLADGDEELAARQAATLMDALDSSAHEPFLVAGDLNSPADGQAVELFRRAGFRNVADAGIDHVLVADDPMWHPLYSERLDDLRPTAAATPLSDHPAIIVELRSSSPPRSSSWQGEWVTADPALEGFDTHRLRRAVDAMLELDGVMSVLVARNGRLLTEEYRRGGAPERLHNLKSASKSVLSAIAGLAIDRGHLDPSLPIGDILGIELEGDKSAITTQHLLTMRSGLESTSFRNYGSWVASRNWVRSALSRELMYSPGERFRYSTGTTHLLSAVIAASTGRSTLDFAREHLFEPLGIQRVQWARDPQGIHFGGNNLSLTPRDMLRFGQLYLDRGLWGDEQIIPWEWVDRSTRPDPELVPSDWGGYGYLWWLRSDRERGAYNASGFGGQYIYVAPADDLVVVVTSTEVSKGRDWRRSLFGLIRSEVIGSARAGSRRMAGQLPSG